MRDGDAGDWECPAEDCSYSNKDKTKVTVHIRCHTGEKPFRCVCGYKTADKGHLTDHLRRMEVLEPRVHWEVSHSTSKGREPGAAQAEGHPHKRLRTQ